MFSEHADGSPSPSAPLISIKKQQNEAGARMATVLFSSLGQAETALDSFPEGGYEIRPGQKMQLRRSLHAALLPSLSWCSSSLAACCYSLTSTSDELPAKSHESRVASRELQAARCEVTSVSANRWASGWAQYSGQYRAIIRLYRAIIRRYKAIIRL